MKYPFPLRTRFGKKREIVAEFLPPLRKSKKDKVVILLGGAPGTPDKGMNLFTEFARRGYWVFYPRYRGSWESYGVFLEKSPEEDVYEILDGIKKGFTDVGNGERFHINPDKVVLIGGSFGGPAALLAGRDPRISKVVAISSVVDWRAPSKAESLPVFFSFTKDAFGMAYRFHKNAQKKLASGRFYNPMPLAKEVPGKKVLLIHTKNDKVVLPGPVQKFARRTRAKLSLRASGGHLGLRVILKPWGQKLIFTFIEGD